MPKPYVITFTDAAKAAAGNALAYVEAVARREIDDVVLYAGEPGEMDVPESGFYLFWTPDGTDYIALFDGPDAVEIDAIGRHESLGRTSPTRPGSGSSTCSPPTAVTTST